jgi:16S rRNA (guanine527-N7)-methyltransferase
MTETTVLQLPHQLETWQQTLHWQPTLVEPELFQRLYRAIVIANQSFNLTRITAPEEFWEKHLWDSLRGIQPWLTTPATPLKLIDIGTGAGFPGLPIAIVQPQWSLTLVDSTRKKINFVQQTAIDLGLKNVIGLSDRAEILGQSETHRAAYDLATIRAVAAIAVCAEYLLPLLKIGGTAILYRGQWDEAERTRCETAIAQLGGELTQVDVFATPLTEGARSCVYVKKIAPTPDEYPRMVGLPSQQPL